MTQLFKNNAQGALVAELSESGTLVMLAAGHGARFPAPMNGDHFLATLVGLNANGQENAWEIVKCTGRATDGLTIVRAQEGTAARTWPIGTRFEMRVTAGTLDGFTTTEQAGQAAPVQSVAGKKGAVTLGKADVGLDKVDNTADTDKPVSKAVQQALAGKEAAGAAAAAVTAHAQASDPHPQYQAKLESGVTIKTVNGESLLGSGDVVVVGGGNDVQDTGWRNVTGILQFPSQLSGTRVFVRRVGDICYMMYHSHYLSGRHSRIQSGKPLPAGFHPRVTISVPLYGFRGSTELELGAAVAVGMNGHVIVQTLSNDVRGSLGYCFVYPPAGPFPSELPGTPAGF